MSSGMQRSLGGRSIALSPNIVTQKIPRLVPILFVLFRLSLEKNSKSTVMYGYGTAMDNSRTIWILMQ